MAPRPRQLVFLLDPEQDALIRESSETYGRSQGEIVRIGLMLFGDLSPEERRAAVVRYMTRSLPPGIEAVKPKRSK